MYICVYISVCMYLLYFIYKSYICIYVYYILYLYIIYVCMYLRMYKSKNGAKSGRRALPNLRGKRKKNYSRALYKSNKFENLFEKCALEQLVPSPLQKKKT